ncbi:hypothetical protein [Nissabacter sp. SGAir0207]|uniref:hypothetical protein n=1 Tax=Nissabacter sp. SGAir0207 TaxID=2126321 RepID=UPI0010CD067C|nr:hypothetical protein [Nissabacter sp. SGAir0207]QCR38801.1 hypothetical protein C1N62_22010 [Nissabacter sp. SGAir0207]
MRYGDLRHWQALAQEYGCQLSKSNNRVTTFTLHYGEQWTFVCDPKTDELVRNVRDLTADEWRRVIEQLAKSLKEDSK